MAKTRRARAAIDGEVGAGVKLRSLRDVSHGGQEYQPYRPKFDEESFLAPWVLWDGNSTLVQDAESAVNTRTGEGQLGGLLQAPSPWEDCAANSESWWLPRE